MIQVYHLVYPVFSCVIMLRHTILLEDEVEAIGHMARLVHLWWHREHTYDQRMLCLCDKIAARRGSLMRHNSPWRGYWLQIVQERLDSAEHLNTRQHEIIRAYMDTLTAWECAHRPLPLPYSRWIPEGAALARDLQRWQHYQRRTIAREMRLIQHHMEAWWRLQQSAPLLAQARIPPQPPRVDCRNFSFCHPEDTPHAR